MASLRKLKGNYYARIRFTRDGKRRDKLFPLNTPHRREADKRRLEVNQNLSLVLAGGFTPSWKSENGLPCEKEYKISDTKEDFLKSRKADGIRESTLEMYGRGLDRFVKAVKNKPVKNISIIDIDQFKSFYLDSLSPNTINMELRMLKAVMNWLFDRNRIKAIPKIKQINTGHSLPIYLTNSEFEKICKRVDPHFARAFWFYRETGCRLSEPFEGEVNGDFLTITAETAKGRKQHDVYLTPELKVILLEMRLMVDEKERRGIAKRKNSIHLHTQTFYKACIENKKKGWEQIKNRKFHSLRHTCAVRTYLKTRDIYAVMKQLGHSSVTTTEIYSKFNLKRLAQDFPDLVQNNAETPEKQVKMWDGDTGMGIINLNQ